MSKDKQIIKAEEVGSLEEVLGENDPLFQPEPEETEKWTKEEKK